MKKVSEKAEIGIRTKTPRVSADREQWVRFGRSGTNLWSVRNKNMAEQERVKVITG